MPATDGALRQGEVLSEVVTYEVDRYDPKGDEPPTIRPRPHPFVIVVSQDCDLDWEFKAAKKIANGIKTGEGFDREFSKRLLGILLCEVYEAQEVRSSPEINSQLWKRIKINKDERYHFLEAIPAGRDLLESGLPELTIDFKRYFTIEPDLLYAQINRGGCNRRVRLRSPYLEHLSHRFHSYLSRVGLPEDHKSRPENGQ